MTEAFRSKKQFKQSAGKCQICGEPDYAVLDVHRWRVEGKDGGKYRVDNCVCVCCLCHRKLHDKKITITGIHQSTAGKVICFTDENGAEQIQKL